MAHKRAYFGIPLLLVCAIDIQRNGLDVGRWNMMLISGILVFYIALVLYANVSDEFDYAVKRLIAREVLAGPNSDSLIADAKKSSSKSDIRTGICFSLIILLSFILAFRQHILYQWPNLILAIFESILAFGAGVFMNRMIGFGNFGKYLSQRSSISINIIPDHTDKAGGFKPMGEFYLHQARVTIIPVLYVGVWAILISSVDYYENSYGIWLVPYLGLLIIALYFVYRTLILPLIQFHALMKLARVKSLDESDSITRQIVHLTAKCRSDPDNPNHTMLDSLELRTKLFDRIVVLEKTPSWPLNIRSLLQYFVFCSPS